MCIFMFDMGETQTRFVTDSRRKSAEGIKIRKEDLNSRVRTDMHALNYGCTRANMAYKKRQLT